VFALTAIQAFFGDCLLLEYGTTHHPKYMLIDGGPEDTYTEHLSHVLGELNDEGHDLELMILSHVDTDHVTGLLDYIAELSSGVTTLPAIGGLWHNSFAKTIDQTGILAARAQALLATAGAQVMSHAAVAINGIAEGAQLRNHALALPISLNDGFANDVIIADTAGAARSFSNLSLTVVGPTQKNLNDLRSKWEEWLDEAENAVNSGKVRVMANSDKSVANLSSIQLLAEADGKSMLLTGDGRSDHLIQALDQAGLLDPQGKLHVDLLKLPHHGSDRNATKTFFKNVTADIYVASANGRDKNPDLATLIWIVEAAEKAGRSIEIVCTNETDSTQKLVSEYPPSDYGYTLTIMPASDHSIRIALAT
jgi:hypothetical protein